MTRRDLIQVSLAAAAVPAFAVGGPKFFLAEDFAALEAFTEILIPTDETPGAREAKCAEYIDFVLAASGEADKSVWSGAMETLKELGFHSSDAAGRAALVEAMSKPERDASAKHAGFAVYQLIKQRTAFAYFTSKPGLIGMLEYKGNSYNETFPVCTHPEHQVV